MFLLYVALSFVYPSEAKIPGSIGHASIYLVENFFLLPGLFPIVPMITVAWSLSYEMFFYLAIQIVIGVLTLRRWHPQGRILLFGAITVAFGTYCAIFGGPIQLIMFLSGMILYEVMQNKFLPAPASPLALLCLVGGLLFTLAPINGYGGYTLKICVLFASFFVLCHACFAREGSFVGSLRVVDSDSMAGQHELLVLPDPRPVVEGILPCLRDSAPEISPVFVALLATPGARVHIYVVSVGGPLPGR